jgi:glycosyltransferase involved in cell wall biosynthesis
MSGKRIIVSSPELGLSGATRFIAGLLDRLQKEGWNPEWLVTGHVHQDDGHWLGEPSWPVHRIAETGGGEIRKRQSMFIERVRNLSPCIYLPTFDFDMLHAVPALPPEVAAVMVVHSDEPVYYETAARINHHLNAIVGVSDFITNKLKSLLKNSADRIHRIYYGVDQPGRPTLSGSDPARPLEIVYCGRLAYYQKRIQDIAEIIRQCHSQKLPVKFAIAGAGPDENSFFESLAAPLAGGYVRRLGLLSNQETLRLLSQADIVIMTSDFEGLPMVLLEAMARGCLPVATRTESGMSELIQDGENGYLLPVGDVAAFVATLKALVANPRHVLQLRQTAFERITTGGFTLERAAKDYSELFQSLGLNANKRARLNGKAILPPQYRIHRRILSKLTG